MLLTSEKCRLHIISDFATPHNNCLIRALRQRPELDVYTWYAIRSLQEYPWKEKLDGAERNLYFDTWPAFFKAVRTMMCSTRDRFLIVGNYNLLVRLMIPWFWLTNRRFWYWTDCPMPVQGMAKKYLRRISYAILKRRANRIFCVGRHSVQTMHEMGIPLNQLANLPIFIDLPVLDTEYYTRRTAMRRKFGIGPADVFFVGASRLIHTKGYDLLIRAMGAIQPALPPTFKLMILGSGPEEEGLKRLVQELRLSQNVLFEPWADPKDYETIIGAGDVFVHPARFDAFGGGTLHAMAQGVPVIGSDGAGTVIERVISGCNGWLYPKEDVAALTRALNRLFTNAQERIEFGKNARKTAENWPPEKGARIICDAVLGEQP